MLSIAHTLISLPFAFYLDKPILIFLAAFITHLLADTLPHWNIYPEKFKEYPYFLVAVDVIGGVFLAWLFLGSGFFTIPVWIAIAGGNTPDVIHGLWDLLGKKNQKKYLFWVQPLFTFHDHLQIETKRILPGIILQVALVIIALLSISAL